MWVLAGAPQELIDAEQGSVVGRVTQSLFGRRQWSGVDSPVLFAGQYEDQESGWVYNRFRFYDPAGGVYGAQDPLGVGSNVGTTQGYVANPLTWVDALGLKAHPITDANRNSTDDLQQKVVGVMDNAGDGARRYGALAMAEVTDSAGNKTILAASKGRDGAILRNDIRRHLPDDVVAVRSQITEGVVGRNTHAEEPLVNYCKANNLSINKLAASRGVCKDVRQSLVENVNVVTPLGGQCKEKNKMSVYRDQLGERSNNLINELLAKGLGLAFYKGKCLEILDVTGWDAKDVYEFVEHLTLADAETADKFQESEQLMAKYSDQLDEMEANQDPNSGKVLEVQTIALATYLMLEEPDKEQRVPVGLEALINSDYPEPKLCDDIEAFLQKH